MGYKYIRIFWASISAAFFVLAADMAIAQRYIDPPESGDDYSSSSAPDDGVWFGVGLLALIVIMVIKFGEDAAAVMMSVTVVSLPAIMGLALLSNGNKFGYLLIQGSTYWAYRWFFRKD